MHGKHDIRALTGLRGIAAMWVVAYHVFELDNLHGPLSTSLRHGYLSVDIFFVLSGFVIAMSYGHLFKNGYRANFGIFVVRRLARIYPLYLAVTCFIAAISYAGLSKTWPTSWLGLLENVFMIQAWGLSENVDPAAWSVSVEWGLYLLFPMLAAFTLSRSVTLTAVVAGLSFVCLVSLAYLPFDARTDPDRLLDICWAHSPYPFMRGITEFTLGICTYRVATVLTTSNIRLPSPNGLVIGIVLVMAISTLFWKLDIIFVSGIPILVLLLATSQTSLVAKTLSSPIAMFFGDISYAVYLLHWEFIRVRSYGKLYLVPRLGGLQADILSSAVQFSSLILLSWLVFRFFENPARRRIRSMEVLLDRNAESRVRLSKAMGRFFART